MAVQTAKPPASPTPTYGAERPQKTLNLWYLARLSATIGIVVVVVFLLHRHQARKQADAFVHQADVAEQEGDLVRAARYLKRYVVMRPADADVRARLGMLMDDLATSSKQRFQAFLELEEVLRQAPDRQDVRRRNIDIAMDPGLGMYGEALSHIKELLNDNDGDGALWDLKGQCLVARGNHKRLSAGNNTKTGSGQADANEKDDPVEAFKNAVKRAPELLLAYVRLANLMRLQLNDEKTANEAIDAMLRNNKDSARAHVLAAGYYRAFGTPAQFAAQVNEAVRCDPDDAEVVLLVSDQARLKSGDLRRADKIADARKVEDDACGSLRRGIDRGLEKVPPTAPRNARAEWEQARQVLSRLFIALCQFEALAGRSDEELTAARRAVESLPERPELRLNLIDVCISGRKFDEANKQLDLLKEAGLSEEAVLYGRGRIAAAKGEWVDARKLLEEAATKAARFPDLAVKVNYLLATCYDRQGLLDRRLEAYQRALPADPGDPLWPTVSQRLAECYAEMGRANEAVIAYEKLVARFPMALIPLARLRYQEVMRQPEGNRDLDSVKAALERADQLKLTRPADAIPRELLRADYLMAKKEAEAARAALSKATENFPESPEPWAALAALDWREKHPEQAAETLARAEKKFGKTVLFRIARARMIPAGSPEEVAKMLDGLAAGIEEFSEADKRRLFTVLAETAQVSAGREVADKYLDLLAESAKYNVGIQLVRFDNAIQRNDESRILDAKNKIVELDEAGSSTRMAQALYLIWRAQKKGDKDVLKEARELLLGLERLRPDWSRVPLAEALILDREGNAAQALLKYREAIDLGERNPDAVRRLIELYYEQRQFAEAEALLRRLPDEAQSMGDFAEIAAELSLQSRDFTKALRLADKAAPADTKDYRKLLWRGRTLWIAGEAKEAEKPFLQARDLEPTKPDAWVALVLYYINTDRKLEAGKTVAEAARRINAVDAPLALGQCYEALGNFEAAQPQFEAALRDHPDDLKVLRGVASFWLRHDQAPKAAELLQRVMKSDKRTKEDEQFVRPLLMTSVMLANRENYEQTRAALESLNLLDKDGLPKPMTGHETADEVVARAFAFASTPGLRGKRDAIQTIEEYGSRHKLELGHQFLLAQLHNVVGDWPRSRAVLTSLVRSERDNPNPMHLRYLALGLIRQPDLTEAEVWVAQLEKVQPYALATVELRARLLAASGTNEKARDYLLKAAERPGATLPVARLLEQIGAGAAAEPLYKRLAAADMRPEAPLSLAAYYGRQGRLDEALTLCESAWKAANPDTVATVAVEALYAAGEPTSAQIDRVIVPLRESLKRKASLTLLKNLAALQNLREQYADAIETYGQVIRLEPKDVLAVNNRAFLLSASAKRHDEALAELQKAKAKFGPIPLLLDTEAQVQISRGQPARAVELLREAIAQEPSAGNYFHLALASQKANAKIDAVTAWKEALKRGLKPDDLHALERADFGWLKNELK
jgi:tetratricopeptide (TPR) repeat protein